MASLSVDHSVVKNLQQQADLLVQRFKNLMTKCEAHNSNHRNDHMTSGPIDASEPEVSPQDCQLKKHLWLHLQSSLLPHLQQQITTLSDALDPLKLWCNPFSQLEFLLVMQSEIEHTLDQVLSASEIICGPNSISRSVPINDQHLKEFKIYRLNGLSSTLGSLLRSIGYLFRFSYELIQLMNLTCKQYSSYQSMMTSYQAMVHPRETLLHHSSDALAWISSITKWLSASEFDLVQDKSRNKWAVHHKSQVSSLLEDLTGLINARARTQEELLDVDETLEGGPLSESAERVAKLLVPIFKLCRLFYKHLSAQGIDRKLLPLYTDMSSEQLNLIDLLPIQIDTQLYKLLCSLRNDVPFDQLVQQVLKLEAYFATPGYLILLHFAPILPNTRDGHPAHHQFVERLTVWNTHLNLAIHNVFDHLNTVQNNPQLS